MEQEESRSTASLKADSGHKEKKWVCKQMKVAIHWFDLQLDGCAVTLY